MSEVAISFGTVTFLVFLLSTGVSFPGRYRPVVILTAAVLFAQWGLSIGSQLVLQKDAPVEIYFFADTASAFLFLWLFLHSKFREWWLYIIATLFIGMEFAHLLYSRGLHEYYWYWIITTLFAAQILTLSGRLWHEKQSLLTARSSQPDRVGGARHKDTPS